MTAAPRVSVVMPVRDAGPYLDASIGSIVAQTFPDFELVVLDDASSDESLGVATAWAVRDARVRVIRSDRPLGLAGSSNRVVAASRAPLVARMDADDVSHPERLAKEVALLDRCPDAVLVGTLFEGIDRRGRTVRSRDRWRLLAPSAFAPFPHGSVMLRRDAFEKAGGYRDETDYWEDLDLFRRLAVHGRVFVLPEALYQYRFHPGGSRFDWRRDEVERAAMRMRATLGRGDESVPGEEGPFRADDPAVLYSLAACRLWAGDSPGLLSRLPLRSLLPPRPETAAIFGVALAAAISPPLTRAVLAAIIACRDRLAGVYVKGEPLEWRFVS